MPESHRIQHMLLTRINVSRGFGHADGRAVTPAWLDRQLELFEGLALPSIRSQTTRDFTWILIASEDTPDGFRQRIESYANDSRTVVHFVGEYSASLPGELAGKYLDGEADRLLTSRIDTDDVVASDYLARVRDEASDHQHCFLNWDEGYLYDLARGRLYSHQHPSNMFVNLIEPIPMGVNPATSMGVIHTRASEHAPVVNVKARGEWIQVIHDQNWMTSMGERRRVSRRALRRFSAPLLAVGPDDRIHHAFLERVGFEWHRFGRRVRRLGGR